LGNKSQLDKKLSKLNDEINWDEKRQQHVKKRLIRQMEYGKNTPSSWMKQRFIPAFSLLLLASIVTMIVLSELPGQDAANHGNDISHHNGDENAQIATDNHDDDSDKNRQVDEENNEENDDDERTEPIEENNSTDTDENVATDNETIDKESNENEANDTEQNNRSEDRILTEQEVLAAIHDQIMTDLDVILPGSLPLGDDQHLTATTDSDPNRYQVVFYQYDEPIPLNNQLLFSDDNPAEVIARLTVQQYDTQEEADDMVGYEAFDGQSGEEIKLGYELKGYQDAGAGTVWTHFNMGRWAFSTQATTEHPDRSESLAKEAIDYLQQHMLPIPKQNGYAHLDAENRDNRIVWEKGTTVYTIDQVNDPINALGVAIDYQ